MDVSPSGFSVHGESPGKITGVGCHDFLQGIFPTQRLNPGLLHYRRILYRLSHQGTSKNTAVSSLSLLQGNFLTQESNQCLLYCRWILYQLSYQGSLCDPMDCSLPDSSVHGTLQARILEWVAMSPSRGSFRPRDRTHTSYVSCIGRQVLYHEHHLEMC